MAELGPVNAPDFYPDYRRAGWSSETMQSGRRCFLFGGRQYDEDDIASPLSVLRSRRRQTRLEASCTRTGCGLTHKVKVRPHKAKVETS
jgi:hypothetical protein